MCVCVCVKVLKPLLSLPRSLHNTCVLKVNTHAVKERGEAAGLGGYRGNPPVLCSVSLSPRRNRRHPT